MILYSSALSERNEIINFAFDLDLEILLSFISKRSFDHQND